MKAVRLEEYLKDQHISNHQEWTAKMVRNGAIVTPADEALAAIEPVFNDYNDGSGGFYRCPACHEMTRIRASRDTLICKASCSIAEARRRVAALEDQ